jgi:hypothetical protein
MKLYFCPNCNEERPTRPMFKALRNPASHEQPWRMGRKKLRCCLVCQRPVQPRPNKYQAKPAMGTTGRMRHSSSEAAYEGELAWLAKLGEIEDLRLCNDVPRETYALEVYGTPAVRELLDWADELQPDRSWIPSPAEFTRVKMLVLAVRTSLVKIASYCPDFSYRKKGAQLRTVADTKGYVTADFSLKRKLMRACHGVDVELVKVSRSTLKRFGARAS